MFNYSRINREVMTDTQKKCESVRELRMAVKDSVERQYMVAHEECIDQPVAENSSTRYVCSGKRSFEAAKAYRGKKTAVLNFANNHAIGGSPFCWRSGRVVMPLFHALPLSAGNARAVL